MTNNLGVIFGINYFRSRFKFDNVNNSMICFYQILREDETLNSPVWEPTPLTTPGSKVRLYSVFV